MFTHTTQIPRSPLASTLTLAFHVGLGLAVVAVMAVPSIPRVHKSAELTYISAAALPDLDFEIPQPTPPPIPPPRVEVPRPEPPKAFEAPAIERPVPPPPPPAPVPERRVVEPPREAPPVVKPAVTVGAFADTATAVRKPERAPDVAAAGFDTTANIAARTKRDLQAIDGFEAGTTKASATRATVTDSGFGAAAVSAPQQRAALTTGAAGFAADLTPRAAATPPRTTSAAGFAADAPSKPPAAPPRPPAQTNTFADAPPAPKPPPQAPPPPRADRPVEVIYKPSPKYTDEARAQRIEGEVTLEVEFTATGQVRVLRVVSGLGHGLDEMAQRAAEQIRFRPATSKGTPVDFRANLTILFRLT